MEIITAADIRRFRVRMRLAFKALQVKIYLSTATATMQKLVLTAFRKETERAKKRILVATPKIYSASVYDRSRSAPNNRNHDQTFP